MIRQALQVLEKSLDTNCVQNLTGYFSWLSKSSPVFSVAGHQIKILHEPRDFYQTLLEKCRGARSRILLTSLYLGNDPLSQKLVDTIEESLKGNGGLDVKFLLDANRGSRGQRNSRQMLLPLITNYPTCQVSMYHTPLLRGYLKQLLPQRYDELVGLQHMKVYLFDDTVIISGANLSEDYFTNRQDRYIIISDCKPLANFYWSLVHRVSTVSFMLNSGNHLVARLVHPYSSPLEEYVKVARKLILDHYKRAVGTEPPFHPEHDTLIFPLIEVPPLGIHIDSEATSKLLDSTTLGCRVTLSTGYFNLTDSYKQSIVDRSSAQYDILMAHPSANGFDKAKFPAGGIPSAYTALAAEFIKWCRSTRIMLHEYARPGWTYHVKGLWLSTQRSHGPIFTLVGSSNFGVRSVRRDMESSVGILSWNKELNKELRQEKENVMSFCNQFTRETPELPDRRPPLWVRATLFTFRSFF